jgi:pimeloyl-ACP methyl ester carboxylesterase
MVETPHLFGESTSMLGVLGRPNTEGSCEVAAIVLNSGLLHRIGPYRLYVVLSRRLVEAGLPVMRIDQSGKGDSARRKGLSFEESLQKDLEETIQFLKHETGARHFIVIGLCSGADDGLYLASLYPEVIGAILLEPVALRTKRFYLRSLSPGMLRGGFWMAWAAHIRRSASARIRSASGRTPSERTSRAGWIREYAGLTASRQKYESIISRNGKLLCVFTSAARWYYNYKGQLKDCLSLDPSNTQVTEVYLPQAKHTYPLTGDREQLLNAICSWVKKEFSDQLLPAVRDVASPVASVQVVER